MHDAESALAALRRQLEDKNEECRTWRVRCLQAEAEVRALKFRTAHTDVSSLSPSARSPSGGLASPPTAEASTRRAPRASEPPPSTSARPGSSLWSSQRQARRGGVDTASVGSDSTPGVGVAAGGRSHPASDVREHDADVIACREQAEILNLREELANYKAKFEAAAASEKVQQGASPGGGSPEAMSEAASPSAASPCGEDGRSDGGGPISSELDELNQKLRNKDVALLQLQSDLVREKQQIERQKKQVDKDNMFCREELSEMTQRAEHLSEQVLRSKKKSSELHASREEVSRLRGELLECESRYSGEGPASDAEQAGQELHQGSTSNAELEAWESQRQKLREEVSELEVGRQKAAARDAEAESGLEARLEEAGREASEFRDQCRAAKTQLEEMGVADGDDLYLPVPDAGGASSRRAAAIRAQQLLKCVGMLRQLHSEWEQSQQQTSTGGAAGKPVSDLILKMSDQLERAQNLVCAGPVARLTKPVEAAQNNTTVATSTSVDSDSLWPEFVRDTTSISEMLQQQLNDLKIAEEAKRQTIIASHCDELDDLVKRHDNERRSLHKEIGELRAEKAQVQASLATKKPMLQINQHFEQQVATVKKELVGQLTDFQERQREQRLEDESELTTLRKQLESVRSELTSSRREFDVVAMLFDRERRELEQLRLREAGVRLASMERQASCETAFGGDRLTGNGSLSMSLSVTATGADSLGPSRGFRTLQSF
eukprot:TRINITY_DN122254_c0_g1_i1.p1 TRINITY_DN122254_c0_g1~~TRINITY_DN122254_c0_g1_i1.p1  ORF type:complete len:722 (+),score=200.65 TRINITY_DN122254_c0_g1_i1:93-2258(+)